MSKFYNLLSDFSLAMMLLLFEYEPVVLCAYLFFFFVYFFNRTVDIYILTDGAIPRNLD